MNAAIETIGATSRNSAAAATPALPRNGGKVAGLRRSSRRRPASTRTVGTTDMPSARNWSIASGSSKTILTGTRCTTLT